MWWMRTVSVLGAAVVGMAAMLPQPSRAEEAQVTAADARSIGLDAYLYFYPIITMDLTGARSPTWVKAKSRASGL